MRLIHLILIQLLAILAILLTLLVIGGPEGASGGPHPVLDSMSSGGDGLPRLGGVGYLMSGLWFLSLSLIYSLIALGVPVRHRSPGFWSLLGVCFLLSAGVWWGMYTSYVETLSTGETAYLFGYPRSTALMLFAVFPVGSLLCLLYVVGFRRFVLTEEDEATYELVRAASAAARKPEPKFSRFT